MVGCCVDMHRTSRALTTVATTSSDWPNRHCTSTLSTKPSADVVSASRGGVGGEPALRCAVLGLAMLSAACTGWHVLSRLGVFLSRRGVPRASKVADLLSWRKGTDR